MAAMMRATPTVWLRDWSDGALRWRQWRVALGVLVVVAFGYCLASALTAGTRFHPLLAGVWGLGLALTFALGGGAFIAVKRRFADDPLIRRGLVTVILLMFPLAIALFERTLAAVYWRGGFELGWMHYHGRLPMALILLAAIELPAWLRRARATVDRNASPPGRTTGAEAAPDPRSAATAPAAAAEPTRVDPPRFEVTTRAGPRRISAAEIDRVQAAGNYVELIVGERAFLLRDTLASVNVQLASRGFIRVHRSHLVPAGAIRTLTRSPRGELRLRLRNDVEVPVGRAYRRALREALGELPIES